MLSPVFISYRRSDTQHVTGRLFARLAPRYLAEAEIFMDVEAIAAGADFVSKLKTSLEGCKICLVMIGPRWLTESNADGQRRIDDPEDLVRLEVAEALARDITVIPVLVDGTRMPKAAELPEPLRPLATRNALTLSHQDFEQDSHAIATRVMKALDRSLDPELDILKLLFSFKGTIPRSKFWIGIVGMYVLQYLLLAALLFSLGVPLQRGFLEFETLTSQQKSLINLANLWVLWPIAALTWKRIADLGHGWELFAPVALVSVAQAVLEIIGREAAALTASRICLVVLLILGVLKGTRFLSHKA